MTAGEARSGLLQQDLVSQCQAGRLISTALLPLVSKRECQHCQMPAQGQTPRLDPHVCPQLTLLIVLRAQQTASAPRLATDSPAVPALSPILHPKLRPAGPQGRGPPTLCSQAHPPSGLILRTTASPEPCYQGRWRGRRRGLRPSAAAGGPGWRAPS